MYIDLSWYRIHEQVLKMYLLNEWTILSQIHSIKNLILKSSVTALNHQLVYESN